MRYATLVAKISELTGVSTGDIRRTLEAFADTVMECAEGEQVRTPLGEFKVMLRKSKRVRTPFGAWAQAPERLQARIRPGKRLQREISSVALTDLLPTDPPSD